MPAPTLPEPSPAMGVSVGLAAVVFDAVGTLIDPDPSVAVAYARAAARQGVELAPDVILARFSAAFARDESDEARGPLSTSEAVERRRWRRIVAGVLPEVPEPDRVFDELWDHFADPGSWRVFDDVAPALEELGRLGLAVRVGSNFDGRLRRVLAGLGPVADLADSAIVSSEVGYRKPHREFFREACRRLVLPPERVLFVGDDRENDLEGPRRAGLSALLVDRRRRDACAMPDVKSVVAWVCGCGAEELKTTGGSRPPLAGRARGQ